MGLKTVAKSRVLYSSYQLALKHPLLPHRIINKLFHSYLLKCSFKGLNCLMFCNIPIYRNVCWQCSESNKSFFSQRYQDTPGVEHIPVVQIDLSVPLKVPGEHS